MINTQTQIDSLIDLAVIQRTELKQLIESLPQLRDHLSSEIERNLEEIEPAIRSELEQFVAARALDTQAKTSAELSAKLDAMARNLESTTAAKYSVLMAERAQNATLLAQAEARIAEAASALPGAVKGIVTDELSRFPRAGEIDQLRREFAEPRGLNPRGRWQVGETYNKLDLVSYNGDSYVSSTDGNREKPSRSTDAWTLSAARGNGGGGGGVTSLTDLVAVPANGELLIGNGSAFVNNTITGGTGVTVTNGPGTITIDASGAQELLTATVTNAESFAITRGQVVYLFGATGNRASVKLADNSNDAASSKTFGVVSQASISAGGNGLVTCVGVVTQLTLGTYTEGDVLYLGATPGAFTNVKPYAPNHLVYVGMVERANNGNGEVYVRIQNGFELDEIHDVQITTPPLAGALLMRDATNSLWKANRLTGTANQVTVTNADTAVTLSLPTAIANVNSVTAQSATNLTLAGGSTGASLVLGQSASGVATFSSSINSTDLVFGASGPSAKSSIAARAARQGLVFDGTANGPDVTQPAFGSADFTLATWVRVDSLADQRPLFSGASGNFYAYVATNGSLVINKLPSGNVTSTANVTAGKISLVVYTRATSGGVSTGTWYIDGVSGGSGTDASNYTTAINAIGKSGFFGKYLVGSVSPVGIYNRALSAAEVVSLYEAGVPAGADYNTASNTNLATATVVASGGTLSGESATGFTMTSASGVAYVGTRPTFGATSTGLAGVAPVGSRWLVTFTATLTSGAAPSFSFLQTNSFASISNTATVTAGSNSVVITTTANGTWVVAPTFYTSSASIYTISAITVTRLGLLLAPDAAQSGGGLTWYDTSGNAANITLPATGVTWNVPTSGFIQSPSALKLNPSSGNVLIGTTTDISGTGGLHVAGTGTASTTTSGALRVGSNVGLSGNAGGASYFGGKVTSAASTATGYNQLFDTTGITTGRGAFAITSTGAGLAFGIEASVGGTSFTGSTAYASYFGTTTATPIHFVTNSVIRQTIDSTGAATFAGAVTIPAATTARASMRIPHGTAPTSPVDGDMWTTTAGLYIRINGATVGPLS